MIFSFLFKGAKLCFHPFLYLENSLNLFFRLEQRKKMDFGREALPRGAMGLSVVCDCVFS